MAQINQYTNEINEITNPLDDDALFDVDQFFPGPGTYESQKLKWGTLQSMISGAVSVNWGSSDLVVTDNRIHNAQFKSVAEVTLQSRIFNMADADTSGNGFLIDRIAAGPSLYGEDFVSILNGNGSSFKVFDNGSVEMYGGEQQNVFIGDDTVIGTPAGPQPNRAFLASFASDDRKTVFTDIAIPDETTLPSDTSDSIVWFRSESKGVLFPNLTTLQRNGIPTPRTGLVIYNTTTDKLQVYTAGIGTGWEDMN